LFFLGFLGVGFCSVTHAFLISSPTGEDSQMTDTSFLRAAATATAAVTRPVRSLSLYPPDRHDRLRNVAGGESPTRSRA